MLTRAVGPLAACLLAIRSLQALLHMTWRAVFPVLTWTAAPLQVCLLAVQSLDALLRLAVTRQELAAIVQGMPGPDPAAGMLEAAEGGALCGQDYSQKSFAVCRLMLSTKCLCQVQSGLWPQPLSFAGSTHH